MKINTAIKIGKELYDVTSEGDRMELGTDAELAWLGAIEEGYQVEDTDFFNVEKIVLNGSKTLFRETDDCGFQSFSIGETK